MSVLESAIVLVGRAVNGAWGVFERMTKAFPGLVPILVSMFFISLVISLIVMPIRGGSVLSSSPSDEVVTDTRTYDHKTKKWSHKTSYTTKSKQKKGK